MNKILILILAAAGMAVAQDGHGIMTEVQKRAHSNSMRYEGTLQSCTSSKGCPPDSKNLVTKRWIYEQIGDFGNSKSLLRFTGPADLKDVALLTVNHPAAASDQWILRPGGHAQKLSVGDRDSRFFNTDFTFEDLEARDADQFDFTVTGEVNGLWRIDAKPKKASQYTHSYFWVDKTNYYVTRVEAYNKKGLAKTIDYADYKQIDGIWTAGGTLVYDVVKKTRTALKVDKVEYNVSLNEADFNVDGSRRE